MNILEGFSRLKLPASPLVLWHVKGSVLNDFTLDLHLVQNLRLQEALTWNHILSSLLVSQKFLPDAISR